MQDFSHTFEPRLAALARRFAPNVQDAQNTLEKHGDRVKANVQDSLAEHTGRAKAKVHDALDHLPFGSLDWGTVAASFAAGVATAVLVSLLWRTTTSKAQKDDVRDRARHARQRAVDGARAAKHKASRAIDEN